MFVPSLWNRLWNTLFYVVYLAPNHSWAYIAVAVKKGLLTFHCVWNVVSVEVFIDKLPTEDLDGQGTGEAKTMGIGFLM